MAVAETGTTVKVSLPFGVPDREMPNVYTLPLMEILLGVALDKVAVPPLMENAKSPTTRAVLASVVVYTASLIVTAIVLLVEANETDETVGATPSITKALFAPRELVAPRDARVKVVALPAASLMVPLLSANALVLA